MDNVVVGIELAERLLGKFTVKLLAAALAFSIVNAVNKKLNAV